MNKGAKFFKTHKKAKHAKKKMRGWKRITIHKTQPDRYEPQVRFYITCNGGTLCEDGYIRKL